MEKKGQLGSTFKYIFILIVGALFLVFFVRFAMQYASTAEAVDISQWLTNLEDRLSALGSVSDATSYPIFATTSELMILEGTLTSGRISHQTNKIIYAPFEMRTNEPLIWTRRWNYPYEITSFFYFSSRDRKYYVVYRDEIQEIKNYVEDLIGTVHYPSIPLEFNFDVISINELNTNLENIRNMGGNFQENVFIFIGNPDWFRELENRVKNVPNSRTVVVEPEGIDKDLEHGYVYIEDQKTMYIGREMLYGAFFANNFDNYEYNLDLALERLFTVTEIYDRKTGYLRSKKPECGYDLFRTLLDTYKTRANEKNKNPATYADLVDSLTRQNRAFRGGCPSVF